MRKYKWKQILTMILRFPNVKNANCNNFDLVHAISKNVSIVCVLITSSIAILVVFLKNYLEKYSKNYNQSIVW